ncbi:MAG: biotin--[Clostridia bacterium]|nr:biotin--[acetyl-CoA-carboxylase] ligase [Clostridia bacterium]
MYGNFVFRDRKFISLESTVSTNNELKRMIRNSDSPVFAVVSAENQTGGRGRLGRSFFSPSGGLYFSVSLPLRGDENNIPFLTLLAGLAVSKAVQELTGAEIEIKWPNDIYLGGKKLGGILCELVNGKTLAAVVGIGINLSIKREEIPSELENIMTSFVSSGIIPPEKDILIEKIVEKLDTYVYTQKELYEVSEDVLNDIKERSFSIGKKVKYTLGEILWEGTVTDIKKSGAAEIALSDGTVREIFCGEITQ